MSNYIVTQGKETKHTTRSLEDYEANKDCMSSSSTAVGNNNLLLSESSLHRQDVFPTQMVLLHSEHNDVVSWT